MVNIKQRAAATALAVGRMGKHDNIFYAIAFSGHGVNLTSIFGQVLADLMRGKTADWGWLPYLDHLPPYIPNEPFRRLGPQLALGYYKLTEYSQHCDGNHRQPLAESVN